MIIIWLEVCRSQTGGVIDSCVEARQNITFSLADSASDIKTYSVSYVVITEILQTHQVSCLTHTLLVVRICALIIGAFFSFRYIRLHCVLTEARSSKRQTCFK